MAKPTKALLSQLGTTLGTLDTLPALVRRKRAEEKLSLRAAADQIGIPWSTLYNLELDEHSPRVTVIKACLSWLAGED